MQLKHEDLYCLYVKIVILVVIDSASFHFFLCFHWQNYMIFKQEVTKYLFNSFLFLFRMFVKSLGNYKKDCL